MAKLICDDDELAAVLRAMRAHGVSVVREAPPRRLLKIGVLGSGRGRGVW
jgi:hypothetical protein